MTDNSEELYARLRPIQDRIVIRRSRADEKTKSGLIHLPATAQEKKEEGVVLAVGPGYVDSTGWLRECTVKRGDRVIFERYAGGDKDFIVLREPDILAVIED